MAAMHEVVCVMRAALRAGLEPHERSIPRTGNEPHVPSSSRHLLAARGLAACMSHPLAAFTNDSTASPWSPQRIPPQTGLA